MRQQVQNSFNKGLNTDMYKLQTPNDVYIDAENMAFVSHEGDELILQNEKGTLKITQFPSELEPLAIKSHNGIAYIISAVKDNNGNYTSEGEIGTFPSPDYNSTDTTTEGWVTGNLLDQYQPLRNYLGDGVEPNGKTESDYNQPFRSREFKFSKDSVLQITALQQTFDDTVNIFFTDWENPAKVINSRFTVLPNRKFRIVDRTGNDDSNLYDQKDFESRINHVFTNRKLAKVEFNGRTDGGNLACGTYKYYFRYVTADGNISDIIGESFNVPVYLGNSRVETIGGLSGQNSNWSNNLKIYDLNQNYTFVRVYFTFTSQTGTVQAFEIDRNYRITNNDIDIVHTGFEQVLDYTTEQITEIFASFDTYRTGTEIQGKMVIGNIKGPIHDYETLKNFAREITIGHTVKKMNIPGTENESDHNAIYEQFEHDRRDIDTWKNAYANPRNVHDYLSYWDGESYCFGVVFVFKNGSTSPAFPLRGIDSTTSPNGNYNHDYGNIDFDLNPSLENFDDVTGENIKGIYRFPKINEKLNNGGVDILAPTFKIPDTIPQQIKDETVGLFFVRSPRIPDAVVQGILFDTIPVPLQNEFEVDGENPNNPRYEFYDYSDDNYKVLPAWKHMLESLTRNLATENAGRGGVDPFDEYEGIDPVKFNVYGLGPNDDDGKKRIGEENTKLKRYWRKQFAFYAPEIATRKAQLATDILSVNSIRVDSQFITRYAVRSRRAFQSSPPNGNTYFNEITEGTRDVEGEFSNASKIATNEVNNQYFSLIKTVGSKNPEGLVNGVAVDRTGYTAKAEFDYVNARNSLPNSNRNFASRCRMWARFISNEANGRLNSRGNLGSSYNDGDTYHWGNFYLDFNEYIGITFDEKLDSLPPAPDYRTINQAIINYKRNGVFCPYGHTDPNVGNDIESTAGIWLDSFGNDFTAGWLDGLDTAAEHELGVPGDGQTVGINQMGAGPGGLLCSIYSSNSGMRSTKALRDLYQPEFQTWFRITQPMYWDDRIKNEVGGSKVDSVDGFNNRLVTAWNGDNYIDLHYQRVFFNQLEALTVDNRLSQRQANVGYSIAYVANSNHNNNFRLEEVVDLNEDRPRSFVPYYADSLNLGTGTGEGNPWRTYRLPESYGYNIGYSYGGSSRRFAAFDPDAPFIQDVFDTRVYISDLHIKGSFQNGYRYFDYLAYKDYPRHIGQLVRLINLNGRLYAIHENGVILIPVGERVGGVGDSAGDVFFKAAEKLPPVEAIGYISELYGSKWINSVVKSDNAIYFVDTDRSKWCRIQNGQGIELFGDFKVQKLLRDRKSWFEEKPETTERYIRSFYDTFKNHIIFTFKSPAETKWSVRTTFTIPVTWEDSDWFIVSETDHGLFVIGDYYRLKGTVILIVDKFKNQNGDYEIFYVLDQDPELPDDNSTETVTIERLFETPPDHLSVTYNEMPLAQWITKNTWKPKQLFSIFDRVYSIPDQIETPYIEQHYMGPYQTYYGSLLESSVEVVATHSPMIHQIFDNLAILGSHTYPIRIEYTTDNGTEVQTIYPRNVVSGESAPFQQAPINNVRVYDSVYKEGIMYVTINPDNRDTRTLSFNNRRVRDKYCKIKLVYSTTDELFIQNLVTILTLSYS